MMPIYTVSCNKCGKEQEIYRPISEMDDLPKCCGKKVSRIISMVSVIQDIKPYKSMVTGETISSRSAHREHLRRHKLVEIGNETEAHMKEAAKKPEIDNSARKAQIAEMLNSKT